VGQDHIILYDGICGLCNRLNRFVIRRDRQGSFRYASLQSHFAAEALSACGKDPRDLDTLYVIARHGTPSESLLMRSEAVLFILRKLGGPWRLARVLEHLPSGLLDLAYGLVARNRYRVFGRYDACLIPNPEDRDRFIEVETVSSRAS
jgi:predicted DCC family thiol-disulfide oxidoreductase YuxK